MKHTFSYEIILKISTTLEQVPELNLENKESLVDDIIEKAKDLEHKMEEKFNEAMDKINKGRKSCIII